MKKLLAGITLGALLMALSGCSGEEKPDPNAPNHKNNVGKPGLAGPGGGGTVTQGDASAGATE